jgi:hypothetical protein
MSAASCAVRSANMPMTSLSQVLPWQSPMHADERRFTPSTVVAPSSIASNISRFVTSRQRQMMMSSSDTCAAA